MKRYIAHLAISVAFCILLSCTREDEVVKLSRETEWITFSTGDGIAASGEVETKAMENEITCEISDWDYVSDESDSESDSETKASLTTTLSGQSGIFGYNFSDWSSGVKPEEEMYNMKGTFDGDELTPSTKVLWKKYTSGSLRFYAYSPYGKFTLSGKEDTGTPYLTYTVPADNSKQIDILCAQSEDITSDNRSAVPLQFKHAMCAVQFKLGIDGASLTQVQVSHIKNSGKLYLDGTWSDLSGNSTFTATKSDSLLLMIPQTLAVGSTPADSAKVTLTYSDSEGSHIISASIGGTQWPAGKKVVYTLKKKPAPGTVEYIYFDFTAGDIILTDTSYSGYAYVTTKDKDSIAVKVPVKGTPTPSTKYYIYQSAPDTTAAAKSNEKIKSSETGYSSKADIGKKNPTLPKYSTIEVNGKSWGEYITNNTDPAAVLAKWNSFPENFLEPGTPHRILICGDAEFDITLDRVYSRYFPYRGLYGATGDAKYFAGVEVATPNNPEGSATQSYNELYGGITVGTTYLNRQNSTSWNKTYTEQITLRLKGDNYFSRINYSKPENTGDGYLKITSEKGDRIAEGTLTVTFPYLRAPHPAEDVDYPSYAGLLNFTRCSLIGAGSRGGSKNGESFYYRRVFNLSFEGGIVYVGTEEINNSLWIRNDNMMSNIGGTNALSEVSIRGGILTSIAYGSQPAIGGGPGWLEGGGDGIVNISGGTVYAHSFGVYNAASTVEAPVMSAAIGGGSSGNAAGMAGTVNISGGTVYAYSVGGCAIGGGTSALLTGGIGTVTISDGGNVVAKSISGSIGTYSATAGVAVGGGRSGKTSGNGGDAKVTITGGTIVAGSIGGGKCGNSKGHIGRAEVKVSGGETSAQFLLVKDKAVSTANTFLMEDGVIKNSKTSDTEYVKVKEDGGAVYMESGTCTISGGTISGCSGTLGGAVYMNGGTFTMSGGTIKSCKASTDGGGVYIEGGDVNISNKGTIDHNIASKGYGGGVCIRGGNFDMTGGNVTNNSADADPVTLKEGNGGGIYVSSIDSDVSVKITGGNVQYNASDRNGGGLCVDMSDANPGVTANIVIGTVGGVASTPDISANSAALSGGGMAVEGEGSRITINSGTVKGNVSAYVKNEDIRNDGGIVDLVGKGSEVNVNYKTIRFYANNGSDPEPSDDQRVITSTNSVLRPTDKALAFKKDFYHLDHWNTKRDDSGTQYALDGGNATMNITEDVALYGQWVRN